MKLKRILCAVFSSIILLSAAGCQDANSSSKESEASKAESTTDTGTSQSDTDDSLTTSDITDKTNIKIASLKGPTTIGMVKLMSDSDNKTAKNDYKVEVFGTADEIVTKIVKGEIDVANVPCNLASVLYKRTDGAISVAGINTLGVLYVVETGETVKSIADLKGKTIYSTGKGTTPEYVLNYILKSNGIDPEKDVTIEFKSESTEVVSMLADNKDAIAVLPQPYVTVAQTKNDKIRIALSLTEEWDKVNKESQCITGVIIARNEFIEKNEAAFKEFLNEFKLSTEYVNSNVDEAAKLVSQYDIFPEAVAKKAIPYCNITLIDGADMKTKISGYLNILFEANPESVGGKLPDDAFYYQG